MKDLHELKIAVGKQVRYLRNQKGWSQEHLANKAEKGKTYISEVECGKHNLSLETLRLIAAALEVPVKRLFDFQ